MTSSASSTSSTSPTEVLFIDEDGWTSLHGACQNGDYKSVEALLCAGYPRFCEDFTPLGLAVDSGCVKTVKVLLDSKMVPSLDFWWALESACLAKNAEIVKVFVSDFLGEEAPSDTNWDEEYEWIKKECNEHSVEIVY